ncbi:helix-turn-helix domain-containing protein [Sphingobacterium faecale]|uniref:Helix-turn-helix transcriptional regulator n=1 Tax=Sphingobacterium faecale TaxID=2803775 RepID=A0ABS1R2W4_9SPHI|nr:AraC family transcriptional regulator [Sphingobacterium faecale]MBL1409051.1 helix-turn-helix transcriptional regulator [Sphingobacterium faecale]
MKLIYLLLLEIILSALSVYGQKTSRKDSFHERYVEVIVSLVATDIHAAHRAADSLYDVAATDEEKIKSLMLLAKIFDNQGDMRSSIYKGMQADTIANATMNFSWQSNTAGFLATAFRQIGLFMVSMSYLERAERANEYQDDKMMKNLTRINILHEQVFHYLEQNQFEEARQCAKKAAASIDTKENDNKGAILVKATNDQLMGVCEFHLGNFNEASVFLDRALNRIGEIENNLTPYIYRMQAEIALAESQSRKAKECLDKIEPYLAAGGVEELMMLTYSTWAKYYAKIGNLHKTIENRIKSSEIKNKRDKIAKQLSDEMIFRLHSTKQAYRVKYIYAIGSILFVLVSTTFAMLYIYRRKNIYKLRCRSVDKNNDTVCIADNLQKNVLSPVTRVAKREVSEGTNVTVKKKEVNISKDTEQRLREQLNKLEKKNFYLEKSLTLNQLANSMGTNPRYVTYIIQKYREKDFYEYIQTKRIEYIIDQLDKSPELLGFKLSYLAEMCGFTSLSKFSTAFKLVTGTPPSAYVHFIKKDQDERSS